MIVKQYVNQSTQTESEVEPLIKYGLFDVNSSKLSRPEFKFQFQGQEDNLSCTIFSPKSLSLPRGFVTSIVDYFKVREMMHAEGHVEVDYQQSVVERLAITFNMSKNEAIQHKKMLKCVIEFIEHLKTLQLQELHENADALWFYAANGGEQILNFTNYPTGINKFLEEERGQMHAILNASVHSGVIKTAVKNPQAAFFQ